jgi:pyruvate dehydrogenase (quinone)
MGIDALTVTAESEVGDAWDWALAADGPTLLEVHCDPEVPPIPPHVTVDQMLNLTQAVAKGDANARHLVYQTVKTKAVEFFTRS